MWRPIALAIVGSILTSPATALLGQELPPVPPLPMPPTDEALFNEPAESLPAFEPALRRLPRSLRDIPFDAASPTQAATSSESPRHAGPLVVLYERRGTHHLPLFFEDPHLERAGWSRWPRLQPGVSSVRFGTDTLLFPWRALTGQGAGAMYTPALDDALHY